MKNNEFTDALHDIAMGDKRMICRLAAITFKDGCYSVHTIESRAIDELMMADVTLRTADVPENLEIALPMVSLDSLHTIIKEDA